MRRGSGPRRERDYLPAQTRFRMTELGRDRHPLTRSHCGVIIRVNATGSGYVVLLDGARSPRTLHHSYIEPDTEASDNSSA
jgi:hypothetical protein